MKARRLFDADATDGYLLDGKYWIDPLIAGVKTNADRIRAMTDEEIENWYWWMHKEMMYYTDSHAFVHDWLKEVVDNGKRM